jgi:hypothetical protein
LQVSCLQGAASEFEVSKGKDSLSFASCLTYINIGWDVQVKYDEETAVTIAGNIPLNA